MATLSSLVDRVRVELGDLGKSFVTQFVTDGSTNRFRLQYAPVDGTSLRVFQDGTETEAVAVEEQTGILVTDTLWTEGTEVTVSGTYFRYFTTAELEQFLSDSVSHHAGRRTDSLGRRITIENLPTIEEYPLAVYATTLALYALATDASFDINIFAPDGVSIPRSERYRQLMEMVESRREQYRELCVQLGIGMYQIEVFNLRRVSNRTNRLVPVYRSQEVDDRSHPERIDLPVPTYGAQEIPWPTQGPEFTAYETFDFETTVDFTGDFTGKTLAARIIRQRGSVVVIQDLGFSVVENATDDYTATLTLDFDKVELLPQRTWWQIYSIADSDGRIEEVIGGEFFTEGASEVRV